MPDTQWPLDKGLPQSLSWHATVGLLLDGVSVERLAQRLYQWADNPVFEPLYLHTHFAELCDLSPCLVRINSRYDPILTQFLIAARQEWGLLVFSDQPWQHLVTHFRWLTSVMHTQGQEVLLRIADPTVSHALLSHAHRLNDCTLFGPCQQVLSADTAQSCWHIDLRPGDAIIPEHSKRYRLSGEQIALLEQVSLRNVVLRLDQHMREYFPDYQARATPHERWLHLQTLASTSCARGLSSEFDITLYANLHGWLGSDAFKRHPDLDTLLDTPSRQTPSERLQHIVNIARHRADNLQRDSL